MAIWLRSALKRNRKYPILLPELDDLQELSIMLSQRIEQWAEGYLAAGEQKGLEKGRLEGRQEGRQEGEARVLARLLTRRFGELPGWAARRLDGATEAQLEAWSNAVLDAGSLAEVFAEPPCSH